MADDWYDVDVHGSALIVRSTLRMMFNSERSISFGLIGVRFFTQTWIRKLRPIISVSIS